MALGCVMAAGLMRNQPVLAPLLPLSAVTYYAIPYDAIMRLTLLPQSIATAAFPVLTGLLATGDTGRVADISNRM